MIDCLKRIYPEIAIWAVLTLASAAFLVLTFATPLHALANGLLITSIALLVTTTAFELVWRAVAGGFDKPADGR